jgi:hypothetical protein
LGLFTRHTNRTNRQRTNTINSKNSTTFHVCLVLWSHEEFKRFYRNFPRGEEPKATLTAVTVRRHRTGAYPLCSFNHRQRQQLLTKYPWSLIVQPVASQYSCEYRLGRNLQYIGYP